MVNATCAVLCDIALINSYHGQSPDYIGNYTIPTYAIATLACSILSGGLYVGQNLLRGAGDHWRSRLCSVHIPRTVSIVKWTGVVLGTAAGVVAFLDEQALLFPGTAPTNYFPLWNLADRLSQCVQQCGG